MDMWPFASITMIATSAKYCPLLSTGGRFKNYKKVLFFKEIVDQLK
jgi:hypothetical protein